MATTDPSTASVTQREAKWPNTLVLLLIAWAATILVKLAAQYFWQMLRTINPLGPPLYPGVWIAGLLFQLLATIALLLRRERLVRITVTFLLGYWACALVSIATSLFFANGTIISGAR